MPVQHTLSSGRSIPRACALVCALGACVLPADQSEDIVVTIEAPSALILRGRTMVLTARTWQRGPSGTLTEVPGSAFAWRSLQPDLASVTPRPDSTALVTPLNEGVVAIQAIATGWEEAEPGMVELRVTVALAIDSVRPSTVRYGEQVTVYGIGLGEIIRASLGQADLIPDPASFSGSAQAAGQLSYWVPYPATSDRLLALTGRGSTGLGPDTTAVKHKDLYHELEAPPPTVELDDIPARGPDTLYYNPALAVVPDEGPDALQLHQDQPGRTFSVILTTTGRVVAFFDPVLTVEGAASDSFPTNDPIETWALGFSGHYCRDHFIDTGRPVPVTSPVTLVRAFAELPYRELLVAVYGEPSGQYTLTVLDGYVTADRRIAADRFEENDYCAAADSNAADPERQVDIPFSDTLTVDNAYEVDWFRFAVPSGPTPPDAPGALDSLVTIRTAVRPFGASDSSDIGLLVADAQGLAIAGASRTNTSTETISVPLHPGAEYYLIVLDEVGVATRYSLCLGFGSTCQLHEEHAEAGP